MVHPRLHVDEAGEFSKDKVQDTGHVINFKVYIQHIHIDKKFKELGAMEKKKNQLICQIKGM